MSTHSGVNTMVQLKWTHRADSRSLQQDSAAEPPPDQWVMGKMRTKVMRTKSQVGMRVVGTGSSGWEQLTGSSARGSGQSWNCCCCACYPCRFQSETPPSPCTEAGRGPRLRAGCDPTRKAPRTDWNFLLHFHHHHHCYHHPNSHCCWLFHCCSSWSTLPVSPHQGRACLCLAQRNITVSTEGRRWGITLWRWETCIAKICMRGSASPQFRWQMYP